MPHNGLCKWHDVCQRETWRLDSIIDFLFSNDFSLLFGSSNNLKMAAYSETILACGNLYFVIVGETSR